MIDSIHYLYRYTKIYKQISHFRLLFSFDFRGVVGFKHLVNLFAEVVYDSLVL